MSDSSSAAPKRHQRPLSPHLLIYQPQLTSVTSILHRIAGIVQALALLLLVVSLYAAAFDRGLLYAITDTLASPIGMVIVSGMVAAISYHFCAEIRHIFFDLAKGMDLKSAYRLGYAVIGGAAVLTIIIMYFICGAVHS